MSGSEIAISFVGLMSLAVGIGLAVIISLREGGDQGGNGGRQGDTHYHYHYHAPPDPQRNRLVSAQPQPKPLPPYPYQPPVVIVVAASKGQQPPTVESHGGYPVSTRCLPQEQRRYLVVGEREELDDWDD
jgi:hypothetical protein